MQSITLTQNDLVVLGQIIGEIPIKYAKPLDQFFAAKVAEANAAAKAAAPSEQPPQTQQNGAAAEVVSSHA